jgi:hypothetical protein
MTDAASVPGPECAHRTTCIGIERTGYRLNLKVFFVERCMDCGAEQARKKAGRGYDVYSTRAAAE